jgi:hypothetical protein
MQNGKGDTYRVVNLDKWGKNYDKIFKRKRKTKINRGDRAVNKEAVRSKGK